MEWSPLDAVGEISVCLGRRLACSRSIDGEICMELGLGSGGTIQDRVEKVHRRHLAGTKLRPDLGDGQFGETHSDSIAGGTAK